MEVSPQDSAHRFKRPLAYKAVSIHGCKVPISEL
jgi:hypothetical protein